MNIAVYTHYFPPEVSAPSIRLNDLAREWIALGHRVQVVTCFPNHPTGKLFSGYQGGFYQREVLDGMDVHRHWTYRTPNRGTLMKSLGHISYLPSALLISNSHIDRPDVVIGSSPTFLAAEAAARTARSRRVPFVMEVRHLWPAVFTELGVMKNPSITRWLERVELGLYRRATRVVTVTESFRQNLQSRNVPPGKVVTIPNGADLDFWSPREEPSELRKQLGVNDALVVMYLVTHGISHGLKSVLAAAAQLHARVGIQLCSFVEGSESRDFGEQAGNFRPGKVGFVGPGNKQKAPHVARSP